MADLTALKVPAWMIARADKRELFVDPTDGRVKIRLLYHGDVVKIIRARKADAEAYKAKFVDPGC